jgi:hypothetical protein
MEMEEILMKLVSHTVIIGCALATLSACSQEDEQYATTSEPTVPQSEEPIALQTEAWLDDFKLGVTDQTAGAITQAKDDFTPGEPIGLSMAVDDAPRGTMVTTYWYGPNDRALGYEIKEVSPEQQRLRFTQENTHDWEAGEYRAEIWVSDEKVREQEFEIVSG